MKLTFVVTGKQDGQLRSFMQLVFSAFPGITVYRHMNAEGTMDCVRTHKINAVFIDGAWDAENDFALLCSLRRTYAGLPVYIFAQDDQYEEDALWNEASGYLLLPLQAGDLKEIVCANHSFA